MAGYEVHFEGDTWSALSKQLSEYIENHFSLGVEICDVSMASGDGIQSFFRIYFHGMFIRDLQRGYVKKIRRITAIESTIDAEKDVKEITNFKLMESSVLVGQKESCPICLCAFELEDEGEDHPVHMEACGPHYFHMGCLLDCYTPPVGGDISMDKYLRCPICSHIYGTRTGSMPFGEMKTVKFPNSLPSYTCGTLQIRYNFPSGIQGPENPSPGERYTGTARVCYLPDNEEGNIVLQKLQLAFHRRLSFVIGNSITTGKKNVVVWNGIHHKTNISGGPARYGYPDASYLSRVSFELANVGIE